MRSPLFISLLYILVSANACRCERPNDEISPVVANKQDCPSGIARCVSGAVEVAEGRASCPGCPCAWKRIKVCERGCSLENVELLREPGEAISLCKGLPGPATYPQQDAGDSVTCPDESDRFFCHGSNVYACPRASSAVAVATCTFGCASEGETLGEPSVDIGIATSVMCRHDAGVATP
jgi:hypothetical protein